MTPKFSSFARMVLLCGATCAAGLASGCSFVGRSGPTTSAVVRSTGNTAANGLIQVVNVDATTVQRNLMVSRSPGFAETYGDAPSDPLLVGRGDAIDIQVFEAPPAVLFGMPNGGAFPGGATVSANTVSRGTDLPQQIVGDDGTVTVPFVGSVTAAGRSTRQIAQNIQARLQGRAHDPQVIVRRLDNVSSNVTVVGDVAQSNRIRLSAKGERLLDAIAGAGGTRQAIDKSLVQITRGGRVLGMPLTAVIADPRENIHLRPDDVVTVLYQPYSFTALGAVGRNAEVPFEGTGLTLSQALGRIGGLDDNRSNVRGVFIFRFENPAALDPAGVGPARLTPDGKVPVIYRIDMRDPATLFAAQQFPIRNKDVLYVSNAPIADFQKFLGVVSSTVFSVIGIANTVP